MRVAVPKESKKGEHRVALVPRDAAALRRTGVTVYVQSGAGAGAFFDDPEYEAAGATIAGREEVFSDAGLILTVNGLEIDEAENLSPSALLVGFLGPLDDPGRVAALAKRNLSLFCVEMIPRITRAQGMDTLSSMAMIAGYKAVLLAAEHAPCLFPLMMTAAGTLTPAKVFVIGAGVAGLQAIATARRLGAVVEGYDIRPEVKEQVESLGASFVELDVGMERVTGSGGYAAEQSKEYYRRQQEALGEHLSGVDAIITTASSARSQGPHAAARGHHRPSQAGNGHCRLGGGARRELRLDRPRKGSGPQRSHRSRPGEPSCDCALPRQPDVLQEYAQLGGNPCERGRAAT